MSLKISLGWMTFGTKKGEGDQYIPNSSKPNISATYLVFINHWISKVVPKQHWTTIYAVWFTPIWRLCSPDWIISTKFQRWTIENASYYLGAVEILKPIISLYSYMIYSQNKLTCPSAARQKLSPHLGLYVKCMTKTCPMGSKWGKKIHGICQRSQIFRPNFAKINRNKDNYPWYNPFTQLPAAAPWLLSGNASVAAANCSRLQPEDFSKWDSPAIVATPMHVKICVYVYIHVLYKCM